MRFYKVSKVLEAIKKDQMVIIMDDPKRENQADIFFPAETVTAKKINFLIKECGGLICVPLTAQFAARLDLPLMVAPLLNTEATRVNFTVSVDAKAATAFGISASDRAKTIKILSDKQSTPADLVRPGHVFPLVGVEGGISARAGHTEAAIALCKLAGLNPCGVICEVLDRQGEPARMSTLIEFAKRFDTPIVKVSDIAKFCTDQPDLDNQIIVKVASSSLPTPYGLFQLAIYKSIIDGSENAVLQLGGATEGPIPVRIHSQCLTGDTLLSLRCDCRSQLHQSMQIIQSKGVGIIIYLSQEGRGIGLTNKIKAYKLQEQGYDTVEANLTLGLPADARDYQTAALILKSLKVTKVHLLTNNPDKEKQLTEYGIKIIKSLPLHVVPNLANSQYLKAKKQRMGHRLKHVG